MISPQAAYVAHVGRMYLRQNDPAPTIHTLTGFVRRMEQYPARYQANLTCQASADFFTTTSPDFNLDDPDDFQKWVTALPGALRDRLLCSIADEYLQTSAGHALTPAHFVREKRKRKGVSGATWCFRTIPREFRHLVKFLTQQYVGIKVNPVPVWEVVTGATEPDAPQVVSQVVRCAASHVAAPVLDAIVPDQEQATALCETLRGFLHAHGAKPGWWDDPRCFREMVTHILQEGPQSWFVSGMSPLGPSPLSNRSIAPVPQVVNEYLSGSRAVGFDIGKKAHFDALVKHVRSRISRRGTAMEDDDLGSTVAICLMGPGSLTAVPLVPAERNRRLRAAAELEFLASKAGTRLSQHIRTLAREIGGGIGAELRNIAESRNSGSWRQNKLKDVSRRLRLGTLTLRGTSDLPPFMIRSHLLSILRMVVPDRTKRTVRVMEVAGAYGAGKWRVLRLRTEGWVDRWPGALCMFSRAIEPKAGEVNEFLRRHVVGFPPDREIETECMHIAAILSRPPDSRYLPTDEGLAIKCEPEETLLFLCSGRDDELIKQLLPAQKYVFRLASSGAPLRVYHSWKTVDTVAVITVFADPAATVVQIREQSVRHASGRSQQLQLKANGEIRILPAIPYSLRRRSAGAEPRTLYLRSADYHAQGEAVSIKRGEQGTEIVVTGQVSHVLQPGEKMAFSVCCRRRRNGHYTKSPITLYKHQFSVKPGTKVVVSAWDGTAVIGVPGTGDSLTLKEWSDARLLPDDKDAHLEVWNCSCGGQRCHQRHRLEAWDPLSMSLWAFLASAVKGPGVKIKTGALVQSVYYPILLEGIDDETTDSAG